MGEPEEKTNQKESPARISVARTTRVIVLILTCLAAGFLGAWLLVASGLVTPNLSNSISQNRDTIVLQEGEIVSDVFNKVSPSTVSITTKLVTGSSRFGQQQVSEGAGSGVIISSDGYILTNKHVVPEGSDSFTVVMSDGKEYTDVKVVGRDPFNDIAFLKINGVNDLTPVVLGDSDQVKPGQKVVAIGNALGIFRNSVTSGIISGIGRPVQAQDSLGTSEQLENLLQTDAAINPGNSGGPLVDLKGEIVGINTAVSQDGEAIGFAIPINDAKNLIDSVLTSGKVVRAYLGVRYVTITPDNASELGVDQKSGALVTGGNGQPAVLPNSPASKAGLQTNDIITKIDGQILDATRSLSNTMAQHKPGDKVELTVLRNNKEQTIQVTLETYNP
jgi:serine protease Do